MNHQVTTNIRAVVRVLTGRVQDFSKIGIFPPSSKKFVPFSTILLQFFNAFYRLHGNLISGRVLSTSYSKFTGVNTPIEPVLMTALNIMGETRISKIF